MNCKKRNKTLAIVFTIFLVVSNCLSLANANGRVIAFKSFLRPVSGKELSMSSMSSEYVAVSRYLPANYVKDASIDYTKYVQKAIDEHKNVIFPNFPIQINENGINLHSGSNLKFVNGSKLIMKPNNKEAYQIIKLEDVENVRITGATLVGDRNKHLGTKGEWGMGINVKGSRDVLIEGANISEVWGDGIYIANSQKSSTDNVTITNTRIKKARRNGITIVAGANIKISNSQMSQIDGTLPMAGICIEPNNNKDILGNINLANISTTMSNTGIHVGLLRYPSNNQRNVNINIEGLNSTDDNYGLLIGDFYRAEKYGANIKKLLGTVSMKNIVITNNKKQAIKYYNSKAGYEYGPKFIFENVQIKPIQNNKIKSNKAQSNQASESYLIRQLGLRGFDIKNFKSKKE